MPGAGAGATVTADIPREVARLQLSGRELDDPGVRTAVDAEPNGPVVVSVCPGPVLPLGKAAAAPGTPPSSPRYGCRLGASSRGPISAPR